jgi:GNAT superfamily N-acetyltransferase
MSTILRDPVDNHRFRVLQKQPEVLPFVDTVRTNADREKDALGFLPAQAYEEAARAGHLFVAVDEKTKHCVGHVLFGAAFPHSKIYQLFITPKFRAKGVGALLLQSLVKWAEDRNYIAISAKVAADLDANGFWERMGFTKVRTVPGGASRGRLINIRRRHLDTPNLFSAGSSPLTVSSPTSATAVFAIDLNVFFDVLKRRPRAESAGTVIGAGLSNLVRVVVTEEFIKELKRNALDSSKDQILELALQLPVIPSPDAGVLARLERDLSALVFPEKARQGKLGIRDRSDLAHLATAIHHSASGFITAEDALVDAAPEVRSKFGVRIFHVDRFAEIVRSDSYPMQSFDARFASNTVRISELLPSMKAELKRLTDAVGCSEEYRNQVQSEGVVATNRKTLCAAIDEQLVCAALWPASSSLSRVFNISVVCDDEHPALETALDALLYTLAKELTRNGPALLRLIVPDGLTVTLQFALQLGFRRQNKGKGEQRLERLALGTVVHDSNWKEIRADLLRLGGNRFEETLPTFKMYDVGFSYERTNGESQILSVKLSDLESALSPTIFALRERTAVMVPIRQTYADELLGTSEQISLLPAAGAGLFHSRVYFSSARNARLLKPGTAVVFYESGKAHGRSAAIAIARVLDTIVVEKRTVPVSCLQHGILDVQDIAELTKTDKVAVTTFDNVMPILHPVSLPYLRKVGCVDASNLVCARRIDAQQFASVIKKAFIGE